MFLDIFRSRPLFVSNLNGLYSGEVVFLEGICMEREVQMGGKERMSGGSMDDNS